MATLDSVSADCDRRIGGVWNLGAFASLSRDSLLPSSLVIGDVPPLIELNLRRSSIDLLAWF
tara:strand:+ start:103 stop:288 length:186 start_codon:yes stop_codon:yes gene_type:complete